jgi:hypothetical protein
LAIEPRTEMGRFLRSVLRAEMVGDTPAAGRVLAMADDDRRAAVAGAVFDWVVGLLVVRRFPHQTDVRELHRYVIAVQAGLEPEESLPAREAEAYLRARLGEPYLLTEIDPDRMGEPLGGLLWHLARDLPLTESDIDQLVGEAENLAEQLTQDRGVSSASWEVLATGPDEGSAEIPRSWVVDWSAIPRPDVRRRRLVEVPRTRPGRYIRALVLNDKTTRDQLSAQMRETSEMSTAIAIMGALGQDLLSAAFPPPADLRRLTATLAYVRAGFRADHVPLLEMDAVARSNLGEDAFTEGIRLRIRHTTRSIFVMAAIQEMPLATNEVDALVATAEQRVMDRPGAG